MSTTKELFPIKSKPKYDTYNGLPLKTLHPSMLSEEIADSSSCERKPGQESPHWEPNYDAGSPTYSPSSPCYEPYGDFKPSALELQNAVDIVKEKMEMIRNSEEFKMLDTHYGGGISVLITTDDEVIAVL